jgi:hypothetical protein
MRGFANGRVVHAQIATDRTHQNLPGVEPDPDSRLVVAGNALAVELHGFLHPQSRIAGAHGVILQRERRAKEGHDPVACRLVHRSLETVNRIEHLEKDRIEERMSLLRILAREKFHRALDVRKQDGDQLALTFERCAAGEDALREMRRRVVVDGQGASRHAAECSPALVAELAAQLVACAAGRTGQEQPCAAPAAELCFRGILLLALIAARHDPSSRRDYEAGSSRSRLQVLPSAGAAAGILQVMDIDTASSTRRNSWS